jgi:hypothetical protein
MESITSSRSAVKYLSNKIDSDSLKKSSLIDSTMITIDKPSLNVNGYRQTKNKQFQNQRIIIVLFLMLHTTTASMETKATVVDQKNFTHCKKYLEELRLFRQIERKYIKLIGFQVWNLDTYKELFNSNTCQV